MSKYLSMALFILLTANISFSQNVAADSGKSFISIISEPAGYTIMLDDSLIGETPIENQTVDAGMHIISVYKSDREIWSSFDWEEQIYLTSGEDTLINIPNLQYTIINTIPYGASVIIDSKLMGTTPYLYTYSAADVELVLSDYMPVRINAVEIVGQRYIDKTLTRESPFLEEDSPQLLPSPSLKRDRIISASSVALTAVTGFAAVYYKFKANEHWDKYLASVNPSDISYYKERTEYYDRLAAGNFGVFQAGFLFSIYWTIKH